MITFPSFRLTYTGFKGPVFDDEIKNALESIHTGMIDLLGLDPSEFAIISGLGGTSGGTYAAGIVHLGGRLYYSANEIAPGQYLIPSTSNYYSKPHGDGISRNTYKTYYALVSNTADTGHSPIFTGNMDSYRISVKLAKSQAIASAVATSEGYTDAGINAAIGFLESYADTAVSNARVVDRGNVTNVDFYPLNRTAGFHTLDVSTIIPSWARVALLRVQMLVDASTVINFKKDNTGTNTYNIASAHSNSSYIANYDLWVAISADRKITYSSAGSGDINIIVAMWL